MRKTLSKNIYVILAIIAAILCCFAVVQTNAKNTKTNQNVVFADQTENIKIENDNQVISSELWVALFDNYVDVKGQNPQDNVLTLDMFKGFPVNILNLSSNKYGQSYDIKSIAGLGNFDLSSFETINLSGNKLESIGDELKNIATLKSLDLSNNNLTGFSYTSLNNSCYAEHLNSLNLSGNQLSGCDLLQIANASVNLQNNKLKADTVILPTSTNCTVNLNNNYVLTANTNLANITYGFQGAKNNDVFENSTQILFAPSPNISFTKIEILENEQLVDTLSTAQIATLQVGNYLLKFKDNAGTEVQDQVSFKVMLPQVTVKLFVNDVEIEYTSVITQNTVVKFYGVDGAEIFVSTNKNSTQTKTSEFELNQNGTIVLTAYQTKDGYSSNKTNFYFSVEKSVVQNWIVAFVGIVGIVLLFVVFVLIIRKIIYGTSGTKAKGKLD